MTPREEAMRRVVEAARTVLNGRNLGRSIYGWYDLQTALSALDALSALPADPEPAEAVGETKLRAVSVAITQPSAETAWAMHVVTADGRLLEYSSGRWSQWALPAPATVEPAK